jgi:hypothetical protein
MTHHLRREGLSHIYMETKHLKTKSKTDHIARLPFSLIYDVAMVGFIQKRKNRKSMPLYHVY